MPNRKKEAILAVGDDGIRHSTDAGHDRHAAGRHGLYDCLSEALMPRWHQEQIMAGVQGRYVLCRYSTEKRDPLAMGCASAFEFSSIRAITSNDKVDIDTSKLRHDARQPEHTLCCLFDAPEGEKPQPAVQCWYPPHFNVPGKVDTIWNCHRALGIEAATQQFAVRTR